MVEYPEPRGGEMRMSREIDTHRVELKKVRTVPSVRISNPEDVPRFVREMEDYDRERFKVIYLDSKNRVIGVENISEGTINAALVHPREAVKGAVLANSAGVILVHNHPSGIPESSREDDVIITKLQKAFNLLGIDVIDAVIIGKEGSYSYKEKGRLESLATGGLNIMETKNANCEIALKAAISTIGEYCAESNELVTDIIIGGVKLEIPIPEDIIAIRADRTLTESQRTEKIEASKWAKERAADMCSRLLGLTPGTKYYDDCIERVKRKIAEGMVRRAEG